MITLLLILFILISGFFSMAEVSFISARKARLEAELNKGNLSAKSALEMARNPEKFMSTTQIGITLTGILAGFFSGEAYTEDLAAILKQIPWLQPYAWVIAKVSIIFLVTYATLIIGELVPKRIALCFPEKIALAIAKPMNILSAIISPFVWFLSKSTKIMLTLFGLGNIKVSKVTEEEIKAVVNEGFHGGEVQEVEQDIVERVFTLGDRDVGSIMSHRSEIVWLDITEEIETIRKKVKTNLFTVYPVAREKLDNILGVVYLKELFGRIDTPNFTLSQVLRTPLFVPENQSVYNTLEQFKRKRTKYGLVTDEFGSIQGIVTIKDITEALIGQLPDADEKLEIIQQTENSWLVDGQYSFYNFLEQFDMEQLYPKNPFNTLSGLILHVLERVPKKEDTLKWESFEMEIIKMDHARIDQVLVTKISE